MENDLKPFTGEMITRDIISLLTRLGGADLITLSDTLRGNIQGGDPLLLSSLEHRGVTIVTIKEVKETKLRFRFRMRLAVAAAARIVPLALPFLDGLVATKRLSKESADRLQVAFDEAFTNAVEHGCLELDSQLRTALLKDGSTEFDRLRTERLADSHYANRSLWISFALDERKCVIRIKDSGMGFIVHYPNAVEQVESPSGRGLMLMQKFTDKLQYNDRGNRVTLVKFLGTLN